MANNLDNIEKRMSAGGEQTPKLNMEQFIKLADKEKIKSDVENEIIRLLDEKFQDQKKPGESFDEWIKRTPREELIKLELKNGGSVDFKGMNLADMKAIFRSENGRDAYNPRELVRGVKMYLKNLDLDGIPFGTFGRND